MPEISSVLLLLRDSIQVSDKQHNHTKYARSHSSLNSEKYNIINSCQLVLVDNLIKKLIKMTFSLPAVYQFSRTVCA